MMTFAKGLKIKRSPRGYVEASVIGTNIRCLASMTDEEANAAQAEVDTAIPGSLWIRTMDRLEQEVTRQARAEWRKLHRRGGP